MLPFHLIHQINSIKYKTLKYLKQAKNRVIVSYNLKLQKMRINKSQNKSQKLMKNKTKNFRILRKNKIKQNNKK